MSNDQIPVKEKLKIAVTSYNTISSLYAEYTKDRLLQFQLTKFISLLPEKGKVLDAGSGVGRDSAYLKEDGVEVIPVDLSEGMIDEAKKYGVETLKGDLLKMVSNEEFIGVWCMATLQDIPKEEAPKLIQNFHKALKKEGILYVAVKEGEGEEIIEKEKYGNVPRFYAFYKEEELNNLLKQNGFEIIESTTSVDEQNFWVEVFAKKIGL
jgi:SAM-dependent methyltransferase